MGLALDGGRATLLAGVVNDATPREGVPPLGSWGRVYGAVLLVAVATIGLLYWFTAAYNVDPQ